MAELLINIRDFHAATKSDRRWMREHGLLGRTTVTIKKGSFFESSHIPLQKLMDLIFYWAVELSQGTIQHQVHIVLLHAIRRFNNNTYITLKTICVVCKLFCTKQLTYN